MDSLFEDSAHNSEYLDRGAAVFVTKHQKKIETAQNDVCIKLVSQLEYIRGKFVLNLKTN